MERPRWQQLPIIEKTGEHHAWGAFGDGDQLGTINLLTPERVLEAARLVRKGRVINLSLPSTSPTTLYNGETRSGYKHRMTTNRGGRDDLLDNFAMQGQSSGTACATCATASSATGAAARRGRRRQGRARHRALGSTRHRRTRRAHRRRALLRVAGQGRSSRPTKLASPALTLRPSPPIQGVSLQRRRHPAPAHRLAALVPGA